MALQGGLGQRSARRGRHCRWRGARPAEEVSRVLALRRPWDRRGPCRCARSPVSSRESSGWPLALLVFPAQRLAKTLGLGQELEREGGGGPGSRRWAGRGAVLCLLVTFLELSAQLWAAEGAVCQGRLWGFPRWSGVFTSLEVSFQEASPREPGVNLGFECPGAVD